MPSGKARLVEMMTLYPQRCIITNYPNERTQQPALDLGFDIEGFGHAYVSHLGMEWLSRQFGFISEDDANTKLAEMAAENDQLKIRIKELEASVARIPEAVEGILDGLKSLSVSAVNDLLGIVGDSSVSDAENAEDGSGSDEPAAETAGRNNKTSRK
jgi:hypothetical protein